MDECVYHYCSLDVFDKIITNKTLRMTDVRQMNDSAEVVHIVPMVKRIILEYYKNYPVDQVGAAIDEAINKLLGEGTGNFLSLAACFSEYPDLLDQWRGYGDDGMGVSIGFDRAVLERIASKNSPFEFCKVHYSLKAPESFIRETIKRTEKVFDMDLYKSFSSLELNIQVIVSYVFEQGAVFFKKNDFRNEMESRLALTACARHGGFIELTHPILQLNGKGFYSLGENALVSLSDLSYFIKGKQVRTYMDLGFSKVANQLIKKVTIGPKAS
ncbi:MAG: DUF2971 domain-containing protein, partial [Lachnospiraceae bacterium]|nr:DUF2971 domain-containing protein [Lachnospiraceae bacterium]